MASPLLLQEAARHLRDGRIDAAEQILSPLMEGAPQHDVLHMMGVVRFHQQKGREAVTLLSRAVALAPQKPQAQFSLGKALARQERFAEAVAAFRTALALKPDFLMAEFELAALLHQTRQWDASERAFRALIARAPGLVPAKLGLGRLLTDAGRWNEAAALLADALADPAEPRLKAALHAALGLALRLQNKSAEALAHFEQAQALDPLLAALDLHRAELLQDLKRYEESLAVYRRMLEDAPENVLIHNDYNDLIYRLGREDEYLKSYDRAPRTPALQLAKAGFLMHEKRAAEAHEVYADLVLRDPDSKQAASGLAATLTQLGRHGEATQAYEKLIARHPGDANLLSTAASAFISYGDGRKAAALCEEGLRLAPESQALLAVLGTAWRLMGDQRDETLNGYDSLIRIFDLEPPEGFSDMADFNAELCAALDGLHPQTREHVNQSLRGGSQTAYHIFSGGHDLVNRLRRRITEAVNRYVTELKGDAAHPFVSRRRRGFAYAGSWSSRLSDCGFHVNHIHTDGWISSCYYAGVPEAVKDGKQGWIKFGEPAIDVALAEPIRRAIQPAPGRLVLFPSYMWHGTVPFRSATPRLTIAFDAVPRD